MVVVGFEGFIYGFVPSISGCGFGLVQVLDLYPIYDVSEGISLI